MVCSKSNEEKVGRLKDFEMDRHLLRVLTDNSPAHIAYVGINDLRYRYVNQKFEETFNRSRKEIIGKHIKEIIGDSNYEFALPYIAQVREGEKVTYENFFNTAAGPRWIKVNYGPDFNDDGEVIGIIVLSYDITDRRQAEQLAQQSKALYHDLVETSQDLIWQCDSEGRYIYLNPAWESIFGYRLEEMLGKKFADFQSPGFAERDQHEFLRLMKGDSVKGYETVHLGKDGRNIHLVFNAKFVQDENGNFAGTRGTAYEITERKQVEQALRTSEHNFRLLFENMLNGWAYHKIITNENGKPIDYEFIEINKAFENFTGLNRDDIVGKRVTLVHPGIEKMDFDWIGTYGKVALTGDPIGFEQYFGPHQHWYLISAYCPQHGYFAVTFEDITQRKQTETKLVELINFNEQVIGGAQDGIIVYDQDLRYKMWNPFMEKLSGKTANEVLGKHPFEVFPFLQETGVLNRIEKALLGETSSAMDFQFRVPESGRSGWVSDINSPLMDANGEIIGVIGIVRNITERKKAEQELKERTNFLDKIIESSALSMWISDEKGTAIKANPACLKLFGATAEEVIGKYNLFKDVVLKEKGFMPVIEDVFNNRQVASIEIDYDFGGVDHVDVKNATHKIVNSIFTPILANNGKVSNVIVQAIDLTDRKRAEEERGKLELQVRQAQKMEAIGTLAGGIAHDFNNLLSIILGYTDLAKEDAPPDSRYASDLAHVLEAGNRAKDLVKQILAFSRQTEVKRIPIQLQSLVKEALKMLRASIPTTIEIIDDIDSNCGVVSADPTQVHQILMNLCTNANHAMEGSGGILKIGLHGIRVDEGNQPLAVNVKPGEYVELVVSDTGVGIGQDIFDRIFEPFFTTKETGKGTGMGLSIIHGIITGYGGAIRAESEPGKGSTFHVSFPVIEEAELAQLKEVEKLPLGRKERILFVDDEKMLADMGKDMLERLGYNVVTRRSSLDALATFQNDPDAFDVVITDQTMPGMTGADLSRRLLQIRPDIPIILCTGYSNLIDELTAKSLGIREFSMKPLTREAIAKLLRKVLDVS